MLLFARYINCKDKIYMQIVRRDNTNPNRTYTPIRSIFDEFFTPSIWEDFPTISQTPSANVWEEEDTVHVEMAVPGLKKEDININITSDSVRISGSTKSEEKEDDKKKYYYRSMESSFEQNFNLPTKVDSEKSKAKLENGVIHLTLPKAEEVKPKKIEIE
jgi:HSP20 family protein